MNGLVLFDVDGTMLSGSVEVHWDALVHGIECATGTRLDVEFEGKVARVGELVLNGMTDHQSVDACLKLLEVSPTEHEELRRVAWTTGSEKYTQLIDEGAFAGEVFPGVIELLERMAAEEIATAVLTGGLQAVARRRMEETGLNKYFPTGAFGEQGPDRASLFAPAIANAEAHYGTKFGKAIAYAGDTYRDVDAAKRAGVKSIGVATGHTPREELERAGADLVFDDFTGDPLPKIRSLLFH